MRHRRNTRGKLSRPAGHRKALVRNQVQDLLRYEGINTTLVKARVVQPVAEKTITLGKIDNFNNRRAAAETIYDPTIVKKLFEIIGPRFEERPGGYTRVIRLGRRLGDAAEMARLELVE